MQETFKNLPAISGLPDDDMKRVVLAFGALYKNESMATDMPLVDILLVDIDEVGSEEMLSADYRILRIGLPQIDSVRVGNIFLGKKRIERNWTAFTGYKEGLSFNFNLSEEKPETIHFGAKKHNGNYYIDPNIFSFRAITEDRAAKARFLNTRLTKLIDRNGITVLIPSLEVLTNMLVPKEQEIRNKLVMLPMDDIVSDYLRGFSHDASSNKYIFELKVGKDLSNMVFLAYLAMNSVSRSRISKIRSSVVTGDPLAAKYPEVLPYHPTSLSITTDGIWIDEQTFLCFRVTHMKPPEDFQLLRFRKSLRGQETSDEHKDITDNVPRQPQKEYDRDDLDIVRDKSPSAHNQRYNIHSEVDVGDISHLYEEVVTEEGKNASDYFEDLNNQEIEAKQLSSAENVQTNESKETAKLAQKEDLIVNTRDRVINSNIFKKTIFSLDHIKKKSNSLLQEFTYIHEDGKSYKEGSLCSFLYPETKYRKAGGWAYKVHIQKNKTFIPRAALIIKVLLANNRYAYLLEIERKNNSEVYVGLIFNTLSGKITRQDIKNLLVEIAQNKGMYHYYKKHKDKRIKKMILLKSVPAYGIYYHHEEGDEKKPFVKVFEQIFRESEDNDVFRHL